MEPENESSQELNDKERELLEINAPEKNSQNLVSEMSQTVNYKVKFIFVGSINFLFLSSSSYL